MQPDIEWHVSFRLPDLPLDKAIYRGLQPAALGGFSERLAKLTVTLEEVVDAREDVVVVRARFVGRRRQRDRGRSQGLLCVRVAAGKLKRLRPFDTEAEALEAAGLQD